MSNNLFFEVVVKAKPAKDFYIKIVSCLLAVGIGIVAVPFVGFLSLLISVVGFGFLFYFIPECRLEYEYVFTNGSVEVAAVYNLSRRKTLFSFEMDQVTMVAPKNSLRFEKEKVNKKRNYTSGKNDAHPVAMMVELEKANHLVMIDTDERIMEYIKTFARSKMYND